MGMRNQFDRIWGIWPSDDLSPVLWDKMTNLMEKHVVIGGYLVIRK
jgi:hypothetical protein